MDEAVYLTEESYKGNLGNYERGNKIISRKYDPCPIRRRIENYNKERNIKLLTHQIYLLKEILFVVV